MTYRGKDTQDHQVRFLRNFASRVAVLQGIAEKELAQKLLSTSRSAGSSLSKAAMNRSSSLMTTPSGSPVHHSHPLMRIPRRNRAVARRFLNQSSPSSNSPSSQARA